MTEQRRERGGMSISAKLPLVIGAVVLLVGGALSTAAYVTVRRTTMNAASERLRILGQQFTELFQTSTNQLRTTVSRTAHQGPIVAYLRSPSETGRAAALATLERPAVPPTPQVLGYELSSATFQPLLATGSYAARFATDTGFRDRPPPGPADSAMIGRFRLVNDTIVYPIVVRIAEEPTGYVTEWRRVATAARARQLMANLIGSEAALYFGNSDGSLWTDLATAVTVPTSAKGKLHGIVTYSRPEHGEMLAAVDTIAGSPWIFAVEFPMSAVLRPVDSFLRIMIGIALLCVTIGVVAGWLVSRRLISPLRQLTLAADAFAASEGASGPLVSVDRRDELGQLASSFNTMATHVRDSHARLEERVGERTRELHDTLSQLQDTQSALARREKLAVIGQLASSVGHELRNPLGVISNAVYYLEMVSTDASPEVKEYLQILRRQVGLSGKIVQDLLDFSRITPAHQQTVELPELIAANLARVEGLDRVNVKQEFAAGLPKVRVDPVHAGQVILNLVANAVQAMGDAGGTVTIRGRSDGPGMVCLEVADMGPGIPAENVQRIFEPLFTTRARGIGLGLAVSRSLAQLNGGDVTLKSPPGTGAVFVFSIPIADVSA